MTPNSAGRVELGVASDTVEKPNPLLVEVVPNLERRCGVRESGVEPLESLPYYT